jgi:hypothetical protein
MGTWKDGNTHVYMIHVAKKKGKVTKQYNMNEGHAMIVHLRGSGKPLTNTCTSNHPIMSTYKEIITLWAH